MWSPRKFLHFGLLRLLLVHSQALHSECTPLISFTLKQFLGFMHVICTRYAPPAPPPPPPPPINEAVHVSTQSLGGSGWCGPPGNFCILDSLRLLLVHSQALHSECTQLISFTLKRFLGFMHGICTPLPPPAPPP